MHYAINLTIALIYAIFYTAMAHENALLMEIVSSVAESFIIFSIPFWVVVVAGLIAKGKKLEIVGAFCGLHILWVSVFCMVMVSSSPEAGSGWLLYLFVSPIVMAAGVITSRYILRLRGVA